MKPTIMKRAFTLLLCLGCVIVLILLPRILQYNNYYLRLVNMTLINSILVMGLNFITGFLTGQYLFRFFVFIQRTHVRHAQTV